MVKPKDTISISFGDAQIEVSEAAKSTDGVVFKTDQESKFKFEFDGLISDKFEIHKHHDFKNNKNVTDIFLIRGLGENKEKTPLVRITHY